MLGALTDTTIVHASAVRELERVDPELPSLSLYSSGMRVGYDHIGSLVNTLVLAYVGSIGLVLSVPITTAIAALMFVGGKMALRPGELHAGHKH